jgi:hypothetical protein
MMENDSEDAGRIGKEEVEKRECEKHVVGYP